MFQMASVITTGDHPFQCPYPIESGEEECRKSLTSSLMESPTLMLLDNLEPDPRRGVPARTLMELLTAGRVWRTRILGRSEIATMDVGGTTLLSTANGYEWSRDMSGRVINCHLDAKMSAPHTRTGFAIDDIRGYVEENQWHLYSCLISLIRSWIRAGRPKAACPHPLGGFREWQEVIYSILAYHGRTALINREVGYVVDDDPAAEAMPALIDALYVAYPNSARIVLSDILAIIDGMPQEDKDMLGINHRTTVKELGGILRKFYGRVFVCQGGDLRIRRNAKNNDKRVVWVEKV